MIFLNELLDLRSYRCPVKAYHEHLTLDGTLLANLPAAGSQTRPTMALQHGNVSRSVVTSAEGMVEHLLCLPIEIIPNGINSLAFRHADNAEYLAVSLR
jgi:hypothetical protein